MKIINNPTGINAIIYTHNLKGSLSGVFPEEIETGRGRSVKWAVGLLSTPVKVIFRGDTPFDWKEKESNKRVIVGVIRKDAEEEKEYKYSVIDALGNEIDPRIRVGKG